MARKYFSRTMICSMCGKKLRVRYAYTDVLPPDLKQTDYICRTCDPNKPGADLALPGWFRLLDMASRMTYKDGKPVKLPPGVKTWKEDE